MASKTVEKNVRLEVLLFLVVFTILLKTAEGEESTHFVTSTKEVITSTNFPNSYPRSTERTWKFETTPGKKIILMFDYFDVEYESNCTRTYVALYDGESTNGTLLGRFCGSEKPPPVISKAHKMLMIFHSGYWSYKGFNATYSTECHQILKSKRGYEKSPNYPSQYPNSTECIWQFESRLGSRIILIFRYFDLEPSVNCDSDYVAFYDGDSTDDMLLGRFCGNTLPAPIISTTNRMLMKFHSDGSNTKQGFNSHWLSTTDDFQSILKVTSTKSFVISPYYPSDYPSDAERFWAFETTPGKKIVLMFEFFQLEYELNCTKDYVALYDGDFTNSALIGRFCGLKKPPPIVSKGNKVLMIFHSDRYAWYKGFNATYATECHFTINSIGGTEKSPIYQDHYPNSPECIWLIESAPGNRIKLAFNSFDLKPHVNCKSDYVALYDGNSTNDRLLGRFCGSELPPSITSTTNRMLVVFHSGSPNTKQGFNFTHWTQSTHIVTSMKGIVTSPNYPDHYPKNAERIWNFETTPGKRIVIMFDYFSMEFSWKCKKDYVSFYDGESTNSTLLTILCDYAHPIISTTHKMLMIFHSDELTEHKGFNATYSTECHQVIMTRQGEERSPNYPAQYPHSTECIWKFETDPWNKITVAFNEFYLEPNANCDSDYVALYDGNSTDNAFLGKYCGTELLPPFVSTANRMLLIFHSNKSNTDQGFKRIFRYSHKAQCRDQVVISPVGVVTSHNYPEIYPKNLDCIWKFESISTQQITLVFDYFHLEFSTRCAFDYVQLYDGEYKNCTLLGRFCGNKLPPPIVSTTNKMLMIFHSDGSNEYNGFRATHATGCNHFVNAIEGVGINFSYRNQSNQICTWEIETTPTNTIKLIFDYFKLQSSDNCTSNYLALYDRNSTNSTLLGKFCGSEIPPPIISTTYKMLMVFYSDGHTYQSFRATFTDCYHVVKSLRGVVTSPNYPEEYPGSMNCIWKFQATTEQRITLIFDSFKLEKEKNCASDYVAFYDGEYMNATFLGRFCGSEIPAPVISKTDKLFMIFHSDESNQYKGFTATHTTGCNHSVNTTEGVIDFTNTLQSNEICSWEIETTPVYTIQIVFDSFKLDSDDNCTSNYVAFYDYEAKNRNLLGKFCGNKIPPPIKSTAHKILMLFHSDGHSHQSFRAKHKIECNNVVKSPWGIVTSPNYPEKYQSSTNCIWKFESTPEQRITLVFESFKLEKQRNCTSDYVAFYDGEFMNGTFLGRFCGSEIPPPIISKTDKLFMIFHSDESNQYKGFNATHTTGCNHFVNTTEGVIVFRNTRENIEICSWEFETTPAYTIQLIFDSFELQSDDNCTSNYVAFYDYETENGTLLGKFCGRKIPAPIMSTAHKMLMLFHSDGHSHQSFRAKHKIGLKAIVSDVVERNLIENFLKTRQETSAINKWGIDITLITVALFLYDPQFFANGNETGEEIAYELTLQLMSKLVMKKKISTNDLALFINAMTVTCINPRTFFGLNVVAELRKRLDNTETANPYFILTLCNAGENITMKEVDNLQRLFRAHLRPSWTEIQAMIVMALKCISRESHFNLDDILNEMVSELTKKQHNNGTIENLQNTALVIQALMATESYQTNFNLSRAIESILNDMKYKQVAIEEVYSFLPIIKWKSLLDINSDHCASFIKTDLEVISNFRNHSDEQIQTQISIIIGDNKEFTRTWKIKVSANYSLFEALENFISLEPDYKIQYIISDGKPYVACIANFRDSTSKDSFWFLYTKPLSSTDDPVLVKISPVDIQVNETNELILWYRSGQWANIQETSFDITKPTESNVDRYIVTPPPIPSPVYDPQG